MTTVATFTLTVFILHISLLYNCWAFNFEPRIPILKFGPRNSYFGYSVAEHLVLDTSNTDNVIHSLVLVGAPRAQSGQPGTNHSGAVYKCQLTTYKKDCLQLKIDNDDKKPDAGVDKDDQWLGVTVKSQKPGGYVMACAHRYVLKGDDYRWGQGICYSLTQFLDYHRAWEPCFNRPVNKAHEQFGYCQAGTSGEISEDYDIIIGTPGPYTWRGTVFTNSIRFQIRDDKSWYLGPLLETNSPVDKYSYLGMSVTSGRFFGQKMSYVSGAPRSNGTGQVIFFSKEKGDTNFAHELTLDGEQFASSFGYTLTSLDCNGDNLLDLVVGAPFYYSRYEGGAVYIYINKGNNDFKQPTRLTGQPESRFGFALTSAGDINKDGYNDLAIGAPYEENGGAVYIYLGSAEGIKTEPIQIMRASDLPKESLQPIKTFGYSLSGSLDLDNNGYPDLVVGAYESDAVIVVRSRPIINVTTRVEGKLRDIKPSVPGCPEDPTSTLVCFAFKACFKFDSTVNFDTSKLKYRIEAETFTGKKFYRVKFNSSYTSDTPNIVEATIYIKGTDEHCNTELVYIKDKSDIQNPIKFKLTYSLDQKEPRMPSEGELMPDINKLPILNQEEAKRIFEARFHKECGTNDICESELDVKADLHLPFEGDNFVLYLGEESVNITIKVDNEGEPAYDANLFINHPPSLSYVGWKVMKGEQIECKPRNKSLVRCELGNPYTSGESEIQMRFNPKGISDDESRIRIDINANTTSKDISPQKNNVSLSANVVRVAELELRGSAEPNQVFYGGEVKGESAMVEEDDIGNPVTHTYVVTNRGPWRVKRVEVLVEWPFEAENGQKHGKWLLYLMDRPQITMGSGYCETTEDQINPLKLKKRDPEPSYTSTTPDPDENEKARKTEKSTSHNTNTIEKTISTKKYTSTSYESSHRSSYESVSSKTRNKRDMVVMSEEVREDGKTQQVVNLDCKKNSAKCYKFSCYVLDIKPGHTSVIKIRARLWNSTFVEDYPRGISQVNILSHAKLKLDPALDIKQRKDNDYASAKTKAYPDLPLLPPQGAPFWIIILSVALGILLLVILVFILWKVGFFERKKPEYIKACTDDKDNLNGYS